MKLRNRLIVAFLAITVIPIILSMTLVLVFAKLQLGAIDRTYGISGTTVETLSNSTEVLARLAKKPYHELEKMVREHPQRMDDATYLKEFNQNLREKKTYLLVRKDETIIFIGADSDEAEPVIGQLPKYGEADTTQDNSIYFGGDAQSLVKQIDFRYPDGEEGSAFIVTDVSNVIPEVEQFFVDMLFGIVIVLMLCACLLIVWIYRGIMRPLKKLQTATENIKEGNLDFELCPEADDELGQLCMDLEDMRRRLKDNAEEKIAFDKENKELISNISHDLKTPVTAIKGYAEGIMDGVADTPEKMEKYIRTIYNKANEMDTLINELTFYSKIDTNRIPYNFNIISVNEYFNDCAEDVSLELESKNVEFGFFNYVDAGVKVIADAEQIKRVVHNIINNSLKYMDKPKAKINLRVKDVGDFIQVELEDNGKGIAAKDLPNIFDRFYRSDASRNSSKGGSGIGLSIVKKIIEEHGGKIWATSREETGTTMYFVLRKYQEVPVNE